ncbi:DEAD/DEAH box helicase [Candidatus Sumerlaeota bacterium]|nr:DEAD/DEAH box helicase [Candidatus Sumerlaeota bacterium]
MSPSPRPPTRHAPTSDALERVLEIFERAEGLRENITHRETIPARPARFADWPEGIPPDLIEVLRRRGIERPYTHQAAAIEHALAGRHVVTTTSTASGKTLCYTVPILSTLMANPRARALMLFPTKALSQDQRHGLTSLAEDLGVGLKIHTYDGDTPPHVRRTIRSAGHIVLTNPDMLHTGILPHHTLWIQLFENLRYVVIDEVHSLRGVFGSHVANVVRRLRRICRFHGSDPVFLCSSATIENPVELTERITGHRPEHVDDDGAPRGEKTLIFYNPPVINEAIGMRRSVINETRRLASRFLARGLQTIVFARSRIRVEILTTYLRRAMTRLRRNPALVEGYRGGYLPNERRRIERSIREGETLCVVSTNALELGIDIGQLRVALMAGYPGTIASTWQQGGRAGRTSESSAVILVASSSPLDQYIIQHPEFFLRAAPEAGIVNPDNLLILLSHLQCAAFELPIADGEMFGSTHPRELLEHLQDEGTLRHTGGRWHWSSDAYPAEDVSLRTANPDNFTVVNLAANSELLAQVDYDSAPELIHEHAIYMHQGETYHIERLDWEDRTAHARPIETDHYTDAVAKTDVRVLHLDEEQAWREDSQTGPQRRFGTVEVVTVVPKYKKVKFETHENVGFGPITLPPLEKQTEAVWWVWPSGVRAELEREGLDLGTALNALAHLLRTIVPVRAMCDPSDFGVMPMVASPFDGGPALYLWDQIPGGIGIARRCFSIDESLLSEARHLAETCECKSGCPACTGPELEMGDRPREAVARLLRGM